MKKPARLSTRAQSGPTLRRQVIFWLVAFLVFIALLWLLSDVLLPFVAGLAIAYLLDPLVQRIQKVGVNRQLAALGLVAIVIVAFVVVVILLVPVIGEQLSSFIERLPGYVTRLQELVAKGNQTWLGKLIDERLPDATKSVSGLMSQAAGWLAAFLKSLWSGGKALVSLMSLLIVTPIVAVYLLFDWDRMIASVDSWVPRAHRNTVRMLASQIDNAVSGFVRGQALVCLILGVIYVVGLLLIGVHFAFLIGLTAGILSFVPYVGTLAGLLLSVGVAAAQFWPDWTPVVLSLALFVAGQMLEGNVLQPYLVGKTIGLHPVWLMFALLAFGYLFGFVGLLVAVPVAASIGVLMRFALKQYLVSPIYTGGQ